MELEQAYREQWGPLVARLQRLPGVTRAEAEDRAQDIFLRMVDADRPVAELLPLAENTERVDVFRKRARQPETVDLDAIRNTELARTAPLSIERGTFARDFDAALRELPATERDAFILTELRGLTTREAASYLGVSNYTVSVRAESARAYLAERI